MVAPLPLVADMRTANNTPIGPEPTSVNLAVRDLFDTWWGGHLWVEVCFSPYAKRPGLQAVYENFTTQWRYAKLLGRPDIPYPGMGTLNSGGTGCLLQFMLDMEIRKSQFALKEGISVDDESLPFAEICDAVREGRNFLGEEHTARHCRELWTSQLFLTQIPALGIWTGDEKCILDTCEELWRDNLKKYEPPEQSAEHRKALENVLSKAKKEFSVA